MLRALALGLVLAAYGWLALGYDSATPAWNNPDEPAHYNYIAQVANTDQLPVLEPGDWNASLLEQLKSTRFANNPRIGSIQYEDWQPPLYYLLAVPVYRSQTTEPARIQALRRFDIVLGGLTVVLGYLTAAAWLRHPWSIGARGTSLTAVAAAAAMVGVPMFTAMSAAISNDALANLLAAALTLLMVIVLGSEPTFGRGLIMGLLLGGALLTKLTLAVFVPVAVLVAGYSAWRCSRSWGVVWGSLVAVILGTVVPLVPWVLRNGVVYGWGDPFATRRHEAVVVGQPRFSGLTPDTVGYWATTTFHSFWAQFGWMGVPVDDRLYWAWGAATAMGVVGLAVAALRALWSGSGGIWVVDVRPLFFGLVVLAVIAALVAYNLEFVQAQGRYLFPGLAAICILLAVGWQSLFPERVGGWAALAGSAGLIGLNVYTLVRQLAPAFAT